MGFRSAGSGLGSKELLTQVKEERKEEEVKEEKEVQEVKEEKEEKEVMTHP